jgi:hypothetical protein
VAGADRLADRLDCGHLAVSRARRSAAHRTSAALAFATETASSRDRRRQRAQNEDNLTGTMRRSVASGETRLRASLTASNTCGADKPDARPPDKPPLRPPTSRALTRPTTRPTSAARPARSARTTRRGSERGRVAADKAGNQFSSRPGLFAPRCRQRDRPRPSAGAADCHACVATDTTRRGAAQAGAPVRWCSRLPGARVATDTRRRGAAQAGARRRRATGDQVFQVWWTAKRFRI